MGSELCLHWNIWNTVLFQIDSRFERKFSPALKEECVSHFAWVGPSERPGGEPLLTDGSTWEHGALVYRGGGGEPETFIESRTLCFRVMLQ